jgi:hypothetical protein
MTLRELLRRQWRDYARNHQDPLNLLIHFLAAPLFIAGCLALALATAWQSGSLAMTASASIALSLVLEGVGHRRESHGPAPFANPWDFVRRYFVEQWITFPAFVLSGGWWRNLSRIGASK